MFGNPNSPKRMKVCGLPINDRKRINQKGKQTRIQQKENESTESGTKPNQI